MEILSKTMVLSAIAGGAFVFFGVIVFLVKEVVEEMSKKYLLFGWKSIELSEKDKKYLSLHGYDKRQQYLEKIIIEKIGTSEVSFQYTSKNKRFVYKR